MVAVFSNLEPREHFSERQNQCPPTGIELGQGRAGRGRTGQGRAEQGRAGLAGQGRQTAHFQFFFAFGGG